MTARVWYPQSSQGREVNLTQGQIVDLKSSLKSALKGQKERKKSMTPTGTQSKKLSQIPQENRVQKTVFDLKSFDKVTLIKEIDLPNKPTNIQEALEMLGGKTDKLMEVIYDGLCNDRRESAKSDIKGFRILEGENEDELGEEYTGTFADGDKMQLINNAVLSIAKMQGYSQEMSKEKRDELKERARQFLRDNPAMLQGLQG